MKWFFHIDSNVIRLMARFEGEDAIGTGRATVELGGEFHGISYATLRDAKAGVVTVDDEGRATLIRRQSEGANHDED